MDKLLAILEAQMTEPTNYGWFHLMFIGIMLAATVLLCVKCRNVSDKHFRRIIFISWVVLVVLEIYKQLVYSVEYTDGAFVWDYQWYAFPYQFCSTPLYALPFVAFLPDGRLRDAFVGFVSFFSLFAGVAVFLYPNDVFISMIGVNIQTMIHHGTQIVLGVYAAVYYRKRLSIRYYLRSIPVFVVFLFIAMVLNVTVYHALVAAGIDETFNMFYVSPYFDCTLPVLSAIYPAVPYAAFFLIYCIGFSIAALVIYYLIYLPIHLISGRKNA